MTRAAALSLLVVLLSAVPASAKLPRKIVPFASVAGFTFDDTPKTIRHRLGKPTNQVKLHGVVASMYYDRQKLTFEFDTTVAGAPMDSMGALGPRYRTVKKHIHVGQRKAKAKRAYPGPGRECDGDICTLYFGKPGYQGTRTTAFTFSQGRVNGIILGVFR